MKGIFTLLLITCFHFFSIAQNINGQWKGSFVDNTTAFIGLTSDRLDYVLELESNGAIVTGYSYTYFNEGNKRYYTICKLKGTFNKETKDVIVTEIERTKYNTPEKYQNCFQTHRLKYYKQGEDSEMLAGSWIPAPDQTGNCGYGRTSLMRRIIKKTPSIINPKSAILSSKKDQPFKDMNKETQKVITQKTKPVVKDQPKKIIPVQPPVTKKVETKKETVVIPPIQKEVHAQNKISQNFEKRSNNVLQTIQIKNKTFTVDFYDSGEIDGDSISVFFNGKLVLSHHRLTDKPLTLTLTAESNNAVNELIMYAENIGEIPPNTALMIVHDGDERYEARISSDTEKNGAIRFTYVGKTP
jgi:hypothetical protein